MAKDPPVIIFGSGDSGRVVLDICRTAGHSVVGFLDPSLPPGTIINDATVLGNDDLLDDQDFLRSHRFVVSTSDQAIRRRLIGKLVSVGANLFSAIHPGCVISPYATIGEASIMMAGVIVNSGASIGRFCFLNTGCTIDHDTVLEDGCQISPGAHISGWVTCGEDVVLGTGALVIPKIKIGAGAVIGAGATVVNDIRPGITVKGTPAK